LNVLKENKGGDLKSWTESPTPRGHEFGEERMSADQKLDTLALEYFERKQGADLKSQIEPSTLRKMNMTMAEQWSCIASEFGHAFVEERMSADIKLEALALACCERKQGKKLK